jgi:short-subunit dehydrogenase
MQPDGWRHSNRLEDTMSTHSQSRVAVVTGGARGIGRATAAALKRAGYTVAICDVDESVMDATAEALGVDLARAVDLCDLAEVEPFIDEVEAELGPIALLVNNAGIMPAGPFLDESDALTERMLQVNLLAAIVLTRRVLRGMVARRQGHIVNIASMGGDIPVPGVATYCGAKAAVVNLTDAIRLEHRGTGVHFTTVHPATVSTDLASGIGVVRGAKLVTPEAVAEAILSAVHRPRDRVYVPSVLGIAIRVQSLLPTAVANAFGRIIGADTVALHFDAARRRSYIERIDPGTRSGTPAS